MTEDPLLRPLLNEMCDESWRPQLAGALGELVLQRKQAATEAGISKENLWATTAWTTSLP